MTSQTWSARNLIAFWILGVCNNYAYVVMLSAAQDILAKSSGQNSTVVEKEHCLKELNYRPSCSGQSAGLVLLCNILPSLIIKIIYPFIGHWFAYGVRHTSICLIMALSLIITALADNVPLALIGVMLASLSSGMGETAYLGLASHYSSHTVSTWSSGTGMAGIAGAFSYALLTDPHMLNLTPTQAMLSMLTVPLMLFLTYLCLLEMPSTVESVSPFRPSEWIDLKRVASTVTAPVDDNTSDRSLSRWETTKSLLVYMIPLFIVYFAEYFINQGLVELTVFDCDHGYGTSPAAQYRWYQVLYQVGVFVSRSSLNIVQLNMFWIQVLPWLQVLNMCFFLYNAIHPILPHFWMAAAIVLYEGLIGGASYVNSFNHIHQKIHYSIREFSLSTASLADTSGILLAALVAIPVHEAICRLPYKS